jgi:hypothetical protein
MKIHKTDFFILTGVFNFLEDIPSLLLGKYPLLHEQPGKGFLLDYLEHAKVFKGNDLFRIKSDWY